MGIALIAIGQILVRTHRTFRKVRLWDAMILAAISWLICPLVSAIPYYFSIEAFAHHSRAELLNYITFSNALFECFSGFTSTGLSLIDQPSLFPKTILWFRSLMQWVGGIGLVVFMVSAVDFSRTAINLYYSEARSEKMGPTIQRTAMHILCIYAGFTVISIAVLFLMGMNLWEAINHSMCAVSTGGFVVTDTGIGGYSTSIQMVIALIMFLGAMSFSTFYHAINRFEMKHVILDKEHRYYVVFVIGGILIVYILSYLTHKTLDFSESIFQWVSSLATCGFSTIPLSKASTAALIFLISGMTIGGCMGSTAGGIKIHRILHVFKGMSLKIKSMFTVEQAKEIEEFGEKNKEEEAPSFLEISGEENIKKLYVANILFSMWILVLIISWIILSVVIDIKDPVHLIFDIASAFSNVGLSTHVVNIQMPTFAKWYFMFIMWIGRLEIIPFIVLLLSLFKKRVQVKESK